VTLKICEKRRKSVVVVTFFGPWTTGHDTKKNELKCTNLLDNKNTLNINFLYIRVANNSYFSTLNFHVKKIFFKNIKSCRRDNLPKIWAPRRCRFFRTLFRGKKGVKGGVLPCFDLVVKIFN
jgi:hypothetical protein